MFNTGAESQVTVAARLGFYSGTTTGIAWFDDLRLEKLSSAAASIQNPGFETGVASPENWLEESVQGGASFSGMPRLRIPAGEAPK